MSGVKVRLDDIPDFGLEINLPDSSFGALDCHSTAGFGEDVTVKPEMSGKLLLTRQEDEILVSGTLNASVRLDCSRCLASYETEISTEIDLVLKVVSATTFDQEAELEDNEIAVHGSEIDLGSILCQEMALDIPMKPLCNEDCPGLCPTCGNVRGSDRCKCGSDKEVDPRWQGLKQIKDKISA